MEPAPESVIADGEASALTSRSDAELFALWADIMSELRLRGLVRTANNPVGDYAEHLVAKLLDLKLAGNSRAGYDAVGEDRTRYQIKARRLMRQQSSRQLGALRNLYDDGFDVLVIVLFGAKFEILGVWTVPVALVREHAVYRAHVNAHIVFAARTLLDDHRVRKVQ